MPNAGRDDPVNVRGLYRSSEHCSPVFAVTVSELPVPPAPTERHAQLAARCTPPYTQPPEAEPAAEVSAEKNNITATHANTI